MKVEIRPIESKKWHGKKGKESFTLPKHREVLYDPEKGAYATGLTDQESVEIGKQLNLDLSNTWKADEAHPYWSTKSAWLILPNHTVILNTEKIQDYIKYKNMLASRYVANSEKEKEEGKWPDATHIIFSEEQDVEIRATKAKQKRRAAAIVDQLSPDAMVALIQIIQEKPVRHNSPNYLETEMEDIIENKPEELIKWHALGKEEVQQRAQVLEACQRNILTREGHAVYYMSTKIAMDIDGAVDWFKDPNNQIMKVKILEKLNS